MGEMRLVEETGGVRGSGEIASAYNFAYGRAHPMPRSVAAEGNAHFPREQMLEP